MRRLLSVLVATGALIGVGAVDAGGAVIGAGSRAAQAASDPYCLGNYATPRPASARPLRFGVDPGIAGSIGATQTQSVPDDPRRDIDATLRLAPAKRPFVVRLNRLFWSDGAVGIVRFQRQVASYTRAGLDVEIQVRYHPTSAEAGNLTAWERYVRHVVDVFGSNRRVVAMTITNEVNVAVSPNTSDGSYPAAKDALIGGIEAAAAEAQRRHDRQLRFGFTYAYRFAPNQDAAFFAYLRSHGGRRFERALGFVGLDVYPGTIFPPIVAPGGYAAAFAQAAGVVRRCYAVIAGISPRVPIWITEAGVQSGTLTETEQASALGQLVSAAHAYDRVLNITDFRWFNLRDANPEMPIAAPLSFANDGLLRSDYTPKPSFWLFRRLVARYSVG